MDVKIAYLVPFAVLLVAARGGRARFLVGGVAAGLAVYLPFFVPAPAAMWRQVVLAQLGRPQQAVADPLLRVRAILGVTAADGSTSPVPSVPGEVVAVGLGLAVVGLAGLALRDRRARVLVGLLAASALVLLLSPSFLQHYTALTAAPLALVAGAGTGRLADRLPGRAPRVAVAVLAVGLTVAVDLRYDLIRFGTVPPGAGLRAAAARVDGCIVADDPTILIVMDRLTPDVARGCRIEPDPSGIGFLLPDPGGHPVERIEKPGFQRAIVAYLGSGDAFLRIRGAGLQLTPASAAILRRGRPLFAEGRWVLRATAGR